jgi:hypothetical protein
VGLPLIGEPAGSTPAVGEPGPVKPLSKADRLRYHHHIADRFQTLSGGLSAIRVIVAVTLLPYLVPTQPPVGATVRSGPHALSER